LIQSLQTAKNDFLADHMIGDHAVLPTVCAFAWMSSAAESVYPNYRVTSTNNYKLFKGLVFDGTESDEYYIDLELTNESVGCLNVDVKISSTNTNSKTVYHYAAQLVLTNEPLREEIIADYPLSETQSAAQPLNGSSSESAKQLYNNGTLFHGESLQGIRDINFCDDLVLLLTCQVPSCAVLNQGDCELEKNNVFANDLVFQAMLVWVKKQLNLGSLPSSTKSWQVYRQVKVDELFYLKLDIVEQNKSMILGDIQLISTNNTLIAKISSAEVTASENLNQLFEKTAQKPLGIA